VSIALTCVGNRAGFNLGGKGGIGAAAVSREETM
jgi:hypothetical protein